VLIAEDLVLPLARPRINIEVVIGFPKFFFLY